MARRFVILTAAAALLASSAAPSFADHHGGGHGGGWHAGGGTVNAGGWHGGAPHWNGGSGRTALVRSGIALALAGMAAVIGTAAGMAEVGNIMIITVTGGELVPR